MQNPDLYDEKFHLRNTATARYRHRFIAESFVKAVTESGVALTSCLDIGSSTGIITSFLSKHFLKTYGIDIDENDSKWKIFEHIFKKICRPKIIQPTFVINYPIESSPLAKQVPSKPILDRFQLIIAGLELANGFSELNDPLEQAARFAMQEKMAEMGDMEANSSDADFLEAMEYGMPPAGGVGIGIDRLAMFLTDTHNIKEIILFPTMRPK